MLEKIFDLFSPPSAYVQKERYLKKYGIQDENIYFYGKGFHCDMCVLHGRNFYKKIAEIGQSVGMQKIRKDIENRGKK